MRKITATIVFLLTSFSLAAYDRCDDLCRVLGHWQGGACIERDGEQRCICQPGEVDRSDVLETVCKDN